MNTEVLAPARQRISAVGRVSSKLSGAETSTQKSVIDGLYQQGSARIRFPNTIPGALHAVLLNTAGGLTGDDHIVWQAQASANSHLCISTAACEKVYRSHGPAAIQNTKLKAFEGARLEWLPQESILFNGSNLKRSLNVELEKQTEALIVESLVFGRQAMDERVDNINVHDRWRIHQNGQLLHAEDLRLTLSPELDAQRQCILHQYSATSTLVFVTHQSREWLESQMSRILALAPSDHCTLRFGVSVLPSRLVVRTLAKDSFSLRKFLIPCLQILNDGRPIPTVWKV